jgi:DNA integrity scanning protein DisA with diadenylate cyclase activity
MAGDERRERLDATFGAVCESALCTEERRQTLEEVIQLAVEVAREGREGRKVGTLFVIGDVDEVLAQSRSLVLDPLYGHPSELLHVDVNEPGNFLPGLGTRHAAAASVSRTTGAVAVAVSQSSVVRVFAKGALRAEIIPELFLMSGQSLFTPEAEITSRPEAGVTLAVAAGNA